jgi:hypothetical protein
LYCNIEICPRGVLALSNTLCSMVGLALLRRNMQPLRCVGARSASIWTVEARPDPGHHERTSPILFVDGIWTDTASCWEPYLSFFSKKGFNCSVLDVNAKQGDAKREKMGIMSVENDIRAAIDHHLKAVPIIIVHSSSVSAWTSHPHISPRFYATPYFTKC